MATKQQVTTKIDEPDMNSVFMRYIVNMQSLTIFKECKDPIRLCNAFRNYQRNGVNCTLQYNPGWDLPINQHDQIFNLLKQNTQSFYESTRQRKWVDRGQRIELFNHPEARFILAVDNSESQGSSSDSKKLLGFVYFQVGTNHSYRVITCHQIHCIHSIRGKGLGKHMLTLLELLARQFHFEAVLIYMSTRNTSFFTQKRFNYFVLQSIAVSAPLHQGFRNHGRSHHNPNAEVPILVKPFVPIALNQLLCSSACG